MRSLLALLASAAPLLAGYSQPSFIDGCQSADGRYTVTAQKSEKSKDPNGPHKWTLQWKDATTGESRTFAAKGVQGGQIYGQLFLPPGGETFALWNHLIMWTEGKSEDHFAQKLKIPKGSGTNLGFGGIEGRTLYVTTSSALYAFEPKAE